MGKTANGDFDPDAWDELLQLFGRDGVGEMIDSLQRDLPLQQQQLSSALDAEDRTALRRIAHNLRGVALQFGAAALAQRCGEIEQALAGQTPTAQLGTDTANLLEGYGMLVRNLRASLHGA